MNIRRIIIIFSVVIVLGVIGAILISYRQSATIQITLDPKSEVTKEVVATLSQEKDKTSHPLPAIITTRSGKQTVTVWGPDSEHFKKEITLVAGEKAVLVVTLRLQSSVINNQDVQFLSLFPYQNGDYRLRAEVGDTAKGKQITKIIAIINYRFSSPDDPASVKQEHDFIFGEIRAWLKSQQVPDSIPVEESGEIY